MAARIHSPKYERTDAMSWAQIRSAINSNLSRTLDSLINDRFNHQETQINTINTRVGTLDTNLAAATTSIAAINTQSNQIRDLTARSQTLASNTVRERLVFSPVLQTVSSEVWVRAARLVTHVPGQYRLHLMGNFSHTNQIVNFRVVNVAGSVVASVTSSISTARAITFHMNANEVYFFEISHALGQSAISLTECTLCYDTINVPRIATLARS